MRRRLPGHGVAVPACLRLHLLGVQGRAEVSCGRHEVRGVAAQASPAPLRAGEDFCYAVLSPRLAGSRAASRSRRWKLEPAKLRLELGVGSSKVGERGAQRLGVELIVRSSW